MLTHWGTMSTLTDGVTGATGQTLRHVAPGGGMAVRSGEACAAGRHVELTTDRGDWGLGRATDTPGTDCNKGPSTPHGETLRGLAPLTSTSTPTRYRLQG